MLQPAPESLSQRRTIDQVTNALTQRCPGLIDHDTGAGQHIHIHTDTDHHLALSGRITRKLQQHTGNLAPRDQQIVRPLEPGLDHTLLTQASQYRQTNGETEPIKRENPTLEA